MAAPVTRMRLTVEVLPLDAENARGPHQAAALSAFQKSRKFALPVELEHTIEQVWQQIEERYKRNYLSPLEASCFEIKKLQDAYDCDLDVGDTVGAIFEGESMRTVKVVPSFVNRDFSMPPTSNLRPQGKQKRARETSEGRASKKRRLEQERELMELEILRDEPIVSTESGHHGSGDEVANTTLAPVSNGQQSRRSKSGSLLVVQNKKTGNEEFTTEVKEESPELGVFKKPALPVRKPGATPQRKVNGTRESQSTDQGPDNESIIALSDTENETTLVESIAEHGDSVDAAIQESPRSSPEPTQIVPQESVKQRELRQESEAPFMKHRSKPEPHVSYSRTTKTVQTPNSAHEAADLLNRFRARSNSGKDKAKPATNTPKPSGSASKTDNLTTPKSPGEVGTRKTSSSSRPSTSSSSALKRPSILRGNMNAPRTQTPKPSDGFLFNSLNILSADGKSQRPSTPRVGPSMSARNKTTPETPSRNTITTQPDMAAKSTSHRRHPSPKVMIPVRTPRSQGATKPGPQEALPPSRPSPATRNAPLQTTLTAQADVAPPASGQKKKQPSQPQRTAMTPPKILDGVQDGTPISTDAVATPNSLEPLTQADRAQKSDSSGKVNQNANHLHIEKETQLPEPSAQEDVLAVPSSDASTEQPSASRNSQSVPRRSAIPIPDNVKHLQGATAEELRAYKAGSPKPGKGNNRDKISPVPKPAKPTSPVLAKRSVRAQKGTVAEETPAADETPPQPSNQRARITRSSAKGRAKDKNAPPSLGSSESSDSNNEESSPAVNGVKATKKSHAHVMKKMFPEGYEESRRNSDPVREVFGERPVDLVRRSLDLDTPPEPAAVETAEAPAIDEAAEQAANNFALEQIMQEEAAANSAPLPENTWSFDRLGQINGTNGQVDASGSESGQSSKSNNEDEDDDSKSVSPANSTRSSPDVSRQPARYLSNSPSPANSSSDEESDTSPSPSQSRAASPKAPSTNDDSDSDSSSSSSDPIEDADSDSDTEIPDADDKPTGDALPASSPPAQPTTLVPATQSSQLRNLSQPAPRRTPIPLPTSSNTPVIPATQPTSTIPNSSQSVSQLAANRRATYSKFPSIKQQLTAARATSASVQQSQKFDFKTASLGRFTKKPVGKTFNVSDSSSEEESSSDSSSSDEDEKKTVANKAKVGGGKPSGGSCSVA